MIGSPHGMAYREECRHAAGTQNISRKTVYFQEVPFYGYLQISDRSIIIKFLPTLNPAVFLFADYCFLQKVTGAETAQGNTTKGDDVIKT